MDLHDPLKGAVPYGESALDVDKQSKAKEAEAKTDEAMKVEMNLASSTDSAASTDDIKSENIAIAWSSENPVVQSNPSLSASSVLSKNLKFHFPMPADEKLPKPETSSVDSGPYEDSSYSDSNSYTTSTDVDEDIGFEVRTSNTEEPIITEESIGEDSGSDAYETRIAENKEKKDSDTSDEYTTSIDGKMISISKQSDSSSKEISQEKETHPDKEKLSQTDEIMSVATQKKRMLSIFHDIDDEKKISFLSRYKKTFLHEVKQITFDDMQQLGKGAFKTAFKANKLVISIIKPEEMEKKSGEKIGRLVKHEVKISKKLYKLKLPGIVRGGVIEDKDKGEIILVTLLSNKGDVTRFWGTASPEQKLKVLRDFATGLKSLHAQGFVHRDIKGSNLFINEDKKGNIEGLVGDLGCSCRTGKIDLELNTYLQDPYITNKKKSEMETKSKISQATAAEMSDPKMDTWAFGLMLCCLNSGINQDDGATLKAIRERFIGTPEEVQKNVKAFIDEAFPQESELKKLVKDMMAYNRADRPNDSVLLKRLHALSSI